MHIQYICGRSAAPGNSLYSTTHGVCLTSTTARGNGRKLAEGAYSLESRARQVRKAPLASVSPRLAFHPSARAPVLTWRLMPAPGCTIRASLTRISGSGFRFARECPVAMSRYSDIVRRPDVCTEAWETTRSLISSKVSSSNRCTTMQSSLIEVQSRHRF